MTQRTSRRRRAQVRSRRKLARCTPSRSSSPRNSSRRSNPISSNRQRLSSTGRRKCRVLPSSRRRRRSPHGDTGWISSVARRRHSGKTTKVSLSARHAISPYVVVPRFRPSGFAARTTFPRNRARNNLNRLYRNNRNNPVSASSFPPMSRNPSGEHPPLCIGRYTSCMYIFSRRGISKSNKKLKKKTTDRRESCPTRANKAARELSTLQSRRKFEKVSSRVLGA